MNRKFAIPTVGGLSCAHFGHCESFAVLEVEGSDITREIFLTPPVHQPGTYPRFLADQGVSVVIAGGMGAMAREIFRQNDIEVFMGVAEDEPRTLVEKFLQDELATGENLCDHDGTEGQAHDHDHHHRD